MTAHIAALWTDAGLPADALDDLVLTGDDPVLPSSFSVARAAQSAIAASGLAAAALWRLRTGQRQTVTVDARAAAIEFRSDRYIAIDGQVAGERWDPVAGLYPTGDGGFVRLHTNFPHHRAGLLALLGCAPDRASVAAALMAREAVAFETEGTAAGMALAAYRTAADWDATDAARAIAALPLVRIERIGDAPLQPLPSIGDQPLSGVRVLDLTRVIAGPVSGRTLAGHGAEVLAISAAHLPSMGALHVDVGRGKRTAHLDLRDADARDRLLALVSDADVFQQGYRPGTLAARGLSPEALAAVRPGLIYGSLSAYGQSGPWDGKRGFDSLAQTAGGINAEEARAAGQETPRALPAQALDHASGFLLAFGIMAALHRRATEGGSWHVSVALARTGLWLRSLPRVPDGLRASDPNAAAVADRMIATDSLFGRLSAVRHAAELSATPYQQALASAPLGTHPAAWRD